MKKWSLGYAFVKQIVRLAFWLSHKRIIVTGLQRIPRNKPVIFAPNHQNALMDPLAVLCTNYTQPVWLARADIFKSKTARPILKFLKIMPVYRFRDGKENLTENEKVFSKAIEVLENKKHLALFPEAAHSGKRQMLAHKKAIPRIAFLAEQKNNFQLGLQIVPVGIYYSHYWHFNRELIVNYGEPIEVYRYQKEFTESPHKAIMALRKEISERVEELILDIKSQKHYHNYELIRELIGDEYAKKNQLEGNVTYNRFCCDRQLISVLEQKETVKTEHFKKLHKQLSYFQKMLDQVKINPEDVSNKHQAIHYLLLESFLALLLLPFFIVGSLLHLGSFILPRHFIQRKVNDPNFYSSFHFVSGLVIYTLLIITLAITLFSYSHHLGWTFLSIVLFLLLGKISFSALQFFQKLWRHYRFFSYSRKHRAKANDFLMLKKHLKQQLFQLLSA